MSKELQRRGEDSNLRRQEYWRSGLRLLARCIKPLCHLSTTRCLCYPLAPLQKHLYSQVFLVVVFSATKVGGSRGSTSSFRAGTPSYTHHPKVQPGSSSIVHERSARVKYDSSADLPKGQGASIHRESEKGNSRKPDADSRKLRG